MQPTTDFEGGRVLGLCLPNWSFGEATLGLHLIRQAKYEAVKFIVSPIQAALFKFHKIDHVCTVPGKQKLNELLVYSIVDQFKPDEILLVDPLTFCESGAYYGLTTKFLWNLGVRLSGVDIYAAADDFSTRRLPYGSVFAHYREFTSELYQVYRPCPIYDPSLLNGNGSASSAPRAQCYSILPETNGLPKREDRRDTAANKPFKIVMTNAAWEDKFPFTTEETRQIRHWVRAYLFSIYGEMARERPVHIDLVGVKDLSSYIESPGLTLRFYATVPPPALRELLSEADLYVTSNIIATTISVALAVGTPVVAIRNSKSITPHTSGSLVIPRFLVCPIGWYEFLDDLVAKSRYSNCVTFVEASCPIGEAAEQFKAAANERTPSESQNKYLQELQQMPRPVLAAPNT